MEGREDRRWGYSTMLELALMQQDSDQIPSHIKKKQQRYDSLNLLTVLAGCVVGHNSCRFVIGTRLSFFLTRYLQQADLFHR